MALLGLPDELLTLIISDTIPEGFETLCLACCRLYRLCKPFIKQHKLLCSQFRNFNYYEKVADPSFTIRTSFELLARIAEEPVVARYIQHADFKMDLRLPVGKRLWLMEDSGYRPDTVRDLFASCRYLSATEWQHYFTEYERDLADNRYCQAAAAFLLTLLPNVESVILPQSWTSDEHTEKLLAAIVENAQGQSNIPSINNNASLLSLSVLKTSFSLANPPSYMLHHITPLLALPRLHSFHGPSSASSTSPLPPPVISPLQIVHLPSSALSAPAISHFLRCTPRLRTLVYSHSSKQPWDICALVNAIVQHAGSTMEELSITTSDFTGRIVLGKASLRGCTRLRKLEIPLDLATCVIKCAELEGRANSTMGLGADADHVGLLMSGLVPASVTRLFLQSEEWRRGEDDDEAIGLLNGVSTFKGRGAQHERTLHKMFEGFAEKKEAQLPALKEIRMSRPASASEAYKAQCESLVCEAEKVGVTVYLDGGRYVDEMNFAEK